MQFVVSKTSYRYDKTLKFAEHLHNEIEKKYPGLS
ncbi:stage II sporulation protein P [Lysinibacillus capsici]